MTRKTQQATRRARPKEVFTFPAYVLSADENEGIVEALVTTFGTYIPSHRSVLYKGAFTKTIVENFANIRVLDNHNAYSTLDVVGKPVEIREVARGELPAEFLSRYPEANGALYTKTEYLLDTPEGLGVFRRIKAEAITEYSIGFDVMKEDWGEIEINDEKVNARHIREVRLREYSPVVWGANVTKTIDAYADRGEAEQHAFDLRERADTVEAAWYEQGRYDEWEVWVWCVFDTHIILRIWDHPALSYPYYQVPYTYDEETRLVSFADEGEWTGGNYIFTPGQMAADGPAEEPTGVPPSQQQHDEHEAEPDLPLTSSREDVVTRLRQYDGALTTYLEMIGG